MNALFGKKKNPTSLHSMLSAEAVAYGTLPRQYVKIYSSSQSVDDCVSGPSSLLVFVHGGAWRDGAVQDHDDLAEYISKHTNIAVALIEYRLTLQDNKVRHPDHINDFHAGLRLLWDPSIAKKFRYDPTRAILVGHSVGGWMVLSAALASEKAIDDNPVADMPELSSDIRRQIQAFIAVESIFSLVGLVRHYPTYSSFLIPALYPDKLIDLSYASLGKVGLEKWPIANQESYLKGGKPNIYIIHSSEDELLSSAYNQEGIDLLKKKGLDPIIDLTTFKGKHDEVMHNEAFWQWLMSIVLTLPGNAMS